jgi:ketosteroid isomerase-like protein
MRTGIALLLAGGVLLAGCENKVDVAKLREALMSADRDWSASTKDVDKFVSYYAADASVYVPGAPLITGSQAIHDAFAKMMATPGMSLTFAPTKADVGAGGDLGYTAGTYEMKSDAGTEHGKYVTVWMKQTDGSWKAKEDIFNADATEAPPTQHAMADAASLKWGPAPDSLPKGAMVAVVAGDPSKPGPFVLRLKVPAGYRVPPHWHPTDENVTVLTGTVALGMGDALSDSAAQKLDTGGVAVLPAHMHHFFISKTASTIQINAMGPFAINYLNPADDPRQKKQ